MKPDARHRQSIVLVLSRFRLRPPGFRLRFSSYAGQVAETSAAVIVIVIEKLLADERNHLYWTLGVESWMLYVE